MSLIRNDLTTVGPLESPFWGWTWKMSNSFYKRKWSPWTTVSKTVNVSRIGWTVIEKSRPEHAPNLHVCTICCRPEIVYDVISDRNVKTIERYHSVNFEVASSNSFRDIKKNPFVTAAEAAADIDDSISENAFAFRLINRHWQLIT